MRTGSFKRVWAILLALVLVVSSLPVTALAAPRSVSVPSDRVYITSSKYAIVPGMEELVLTTNNTKGTDQLIGYILDVDAGNFASGDIQIVACYKDHAYDSFGLQTVTDQAKAYERDNPGKKVVGGINADFFNMNTGEPAGAFVMDGTVYHEAYGRPYFAILKDGTAVIREASVPLDDVYQAVGGDQLLVRDGVAQQFEGDYASLKYSRCAIGIRADGSVVTYTTHGISAPTSCGETYNDLAANFVAQGCVIAMNVDGGGSATMASVREGTGKLAVQNSPSDGTPRTVSTTLLFVSTVESDGAFHHASLTPNNAYYTPTKSDKYPTTVQFGAVGVDASGAKCDLPDSGLTWALAADYAAAGSIDDAGLFTAAKGYTGTVGVELLHNGKAVGETTIRIAEPETIAFGGTGVSLKYEESTDLGLVVKGEGVILNHKVGDFDWTVDCTTDGVADKTFGTVTDNIFTSGVKQPFAMEGNITAAYTKADGTKLSTTIFAEVGKMPIVAMDFETLGSRGKDCIGLWNWGSRANQFSDGTPDQVYEFENFDIFYYLQSTTYSSDSQWIEEIYATTQPWTENEDGTVTINWEGKTYSGVKEETYGVHGEKWVSYTDENGDGYYWRGFIDGDTWTGNYNAGGGSASAFLAADGYIMYPWHNAANLSVAGDLQGAGSQIVDATEGEVRFGEHALKLTYDFTRFAPTGGSKNTSVYYRVTEGMKAQGSPTGLGMWVYAPEGMSNFWLWATLSFWDGTQWKNQTLHYKPAGAEKTCQYTGINWTGWSYVELDLTVLYNDYGAIVDAEHPVQVRPGQGLLQITYIPGGTSDGEGNAIVCGSKSEGHFYIDDVRWVYGTNVDDLDSPVIVGTSANGTALSTTEKTVLTSNDVTFSVDFTDPQGENFSGIDVTATQLFLDGTVLPASQFAASADRAQTVDLSLANGDHTLEVHISDNFGNKVSQTYHFVVDNPNTKIPVISIACPDAAELGGDYKVVVSVESIEALLKIDSITTTVSYDNVAKLDFPKVLDGVSFYDDYGNKLTMAADGKYYDANGVLVEDPLRYSGTMMFSRGVQALGENLTGSIRNRLTTSTTRAFTAKATVNDAVTADKTLLTFSLPVPSNFTEMDKVPVTVTVNFTTTDGNTYTVSTGKLNNAVEAYYEIVDGIQISGAESGTLTVIAADGSAVDTTNLQVFVGDTAIEGTWDGNVFTTGYFTALAPNTTLKNVYVGDSVNKHYSFLHTVDVCGAAAVGPFAVTLNATSGDSNTMQQVTWMSGETTDASAVELQYMTKAAYEAANSFDGAASVAASSVLTDFILAGVEYKVAYVNNATITGLTPGTKYVCRVSDGKGNWSEAVEFCTYTDNGTTDFVVIGDAQLHGDDVADAAAIESLKKLAELNSNVDFGIQTGDFVDGGTNFTQWEQILRQFGGAFKGIDFVHTMGNHEAYTSSGTPATVITTRLYGLTEAETKFYSAEYGDVYVAVINQAATADLSEAAAWLIEDAAKSDCTWKVMVTHQPPYYTNPNGSSDGHHKVLVPACEEAGIDFVFGGHDHAYARTEQISAGKAVNLDTDPTTNAYVDANGTIVPTQGQGTVYFICGSMDPGGEYTVANNPDFHFAKATNEYESLYLSVSADKGKFTVNTYDMVNGVATLIDTYTMYNGNGICDKAGSHVITQGEALYNPATGKLVCEVCGKELDPAEENYTGYAVNINGVDEYGDSQYYFFVGALKTGWFPMGADFLYANEDGLLDHKVANYSTNTCTEHGKNKAYSPRYNLTYTGGIARYSGHNYEVNGEGDLVCTNTYFVTTANGYEERACGHVAVDIANWDFSLAFTSATYNGKAKTPAITIKNPATGETLEFHTDGEGILTDYSRTWNNNKNVGTATVVIEANPNGDYFNSNGAVTLTLKIRPAAPENLTATATSSTSIKLSWDAVEQATAYRIYYRNAQGGWSRLAETTETSYVAENLNAETTYEYAVRAVAVVEQIEYASTYSEPVFCETAGGSSLANEAFTVKLSFTKTSYNGNQKKPVPTITDAAGNVLVRNTDYTVAWGENVNAGVGTVIITGRGNYIGERTVEFSIAPQNLSDAVVTVAAADYTGEAITPVVSVKDKNGLDMVEGVDYTVAYADNTNAGTATVQVTGMGNYTGTASQTFTINPISLEGKTAVVADDELIYVDSAVEPAVTVEGLEAGKDYTVSYKNNTAAGEATAVVTGIGNYVGTLEVNFHIHSKKVIKGYDATCTETGLSDGAYCSLCDRVIIDQEELPALGHKYVNGVCSVCGAKDPDYKDTMRIFGQDRYETAIKVANELKSLLKVEKFEAIVVASGESFADALSGSYLANQKKAPILLVNSGHEAEVNAYIAENLADNGVVYLLGGTARISDNVGKGIEGITVKRLAGVDRYETNLQILMEAGVSGNEILVCSGKNFADGLSVSAVNKPVLLVKDELSEEQKSFLAEQSNCKFFIIGGTNAISTDLGKDLEAYGNTKRLSGATRYETSALVAKEFFANSKQATLVYGNNFPDGLSGGPLSYALGGAMLLVTDGNQAAAEAYAKEAGVTSGVVLGGSTLVSDKTVKTVFGMTAEGVIIVK